MTVYLIRAGLTGPVKIGSAVDPVVRIKDLQVAHYESLVLIKLWEGGKAEELALQARFADLHIRGEWYGFSRLMLADVGLTELPLPTPRRVMKVAPLEAPVGRVSWADSPEQEARYVEARRLYGSWRRRKKSA